MEKAEEEIDAFGPFMAFEADLRHLAEKIITIMEVNEQKKFDNCVVGMLPTADPNACAIAVPDGGMIVAVDFGLVPYYFVSENPSIAYHGKCHPFRDHAKGFS